MSRTEELFKTKTSRVLNIYCTAGYPNLDDTMVVLRALQKNGADIIELGIPYSDPLADGPVIQASSARALRNGMNIPILFEQLKDMRKEIRVPLILMGYLNPLIQYGFEKFCSSAARIGIDGLIIPDIPLYEFEREYKQVIEKYGLDFTFLVTPETPEDRLRKIDSLSTGFLYAVSSSSITGSEKDMGAVENYLERLKQMNLKNPLMVGFGIKDRHSFETVCQYAHGAIIGSAYVKAIEHAYDIMKTTEEFVGRLGINGQ